MAPGVKKGFFPCQLPGERASFKQRAFRTFVRLHSRGKNPFSQPASRSVAPSSPSFTFSCALKPECVPQRHRSCTDPRPWTPFGPAGHTRGCHRHPALRAPARGAATLVRTCSYVLFFPVRPWTSSTASRSPFPVRGAATLARACSWGLFLPVRPWTSSGPSGHLLRARRRLGVPFGEAVSAAD